MDSNDLVRDTYAHFGLATYMAQVLEHGIVNAMVVANLPGRESITRSDIDAFMDRQFKNTLGQLLRQLGEYVTVPADLSEVLGDALAKRNWLARHYFRERATEFMTDIGCSRMITELEALQLLFDDADQKLCAIVRPIREKYWVSDDVIAAELRAFVFEALRLEG